MAAKAKAKQSVSQRDSALNNFGEPLPFRAALGILMGDDALDTAIWQGLNAPGNSKVDMRTVGEFDCD